MSQTGSALKVHISDEYDDYFTKDFHDPSLMALDDAPIWSSGIEGGTLGLYSSQGFYLFTFRLTRKDALMMPRLTLNAPGWPAPIEVLAANVDGDALYGAVLSRGQAESVIQGKAKLAWKHFEDFQQEWQDIRLC